VYPTAEGPDLLKKYSGANKYVATSNKGEMPPATRSGRSRCRQGLLLRTQPDQPLHGELAQQVQDQRGRSVDLYIQHDSPGKDKEQNWLPAPSDAFVLMMRVCTGPPKRRRLFSTGRGSRPR